MKYKNTILPIVVIMTLACSFTPQAQGALTAPQASVTPRFTAIPTYTAAPVLPTVTATALPRYCVTAESVQLLNTTHERIDGLYAYKGDVVRYVTAEDGWYTMEYKGLLVVIYSRWVQPC